MWTLTSSKGRQAERTARRKEWLILIVRCSVLPSLLGSCVINSRNGLFNWNPSKDALIQLRLVMSHPWKIFYLNTDCSIAVCRHESMDVLFSSQREALEFFWHRRARIFSNNSQNTKLIAADNIFQHKLGLSSMVSNCSAIDCNGSPAHSFSEETRSQNLKHDCKYLRALSLSGGL